MKKIFCLVLAIVMVLSFAACGNKTEEDNKPAGSNQTITENNDKSSDSSKITVEDVKNAKETDASLFEYKEVEGGIAITGFTGEDKIVVIPDSIDGKNVISIEDHAFVNNKTILGLRLSDSVTQICSNAFENCTSLEVFVSGKSLLTILEYAFNNCKSLSSVELNEGLKTLEDLCFGETNMSELYIPASVETINTPFTANKDKTLKIISVSGGAAEKYVSIYGENWNQVFEAK